MLWLCHTVTSTAHCNCAQNLRRLGLHFLIPTSSWCVGQCASLIASLDLADKKEWRKKKRPFVLRMSRKSYTQITSISLHFSSRVARCVVWKNETWENAFTVVWFHLNCSNSCWNQGRTEGTQTETFYLSSDCAGELCVILKVQLTWHNTPIKRWSTGRKLGAKLVIASASWRGEDKEAGLREWDVLRVQLVLLLNGPKQNGPKGKKMTFHCFPSLKLSSWQRGAGGVTPRNSQ